MMNLWEFLKLTFKRFLHVEPLPATCLRKHESKTATYLCDNVSRKACLCAILIFPLRRLSSLKNSLTGVVRKKEKKNHFLPATKHVSRGLIQQFAAALLSLFLSLFLSRSPERLKVDRGVERPARLSKLIFFFCFRAVGTEKRRTNRREGDVAGASGSRLSPMRPSFWAASGSLSRG